MTYQVRSHARTGASRGGIGTRRRLLRAAFKAQASRCFYCRCLMVISGEFGIGHNHPLRATLDEKIPLWMGGPVNAENCVAACNRCNNKKGPLDAATFLALRNHPAVLGLALREAARLATAVALGDTIAEQRVTNALRAVGVARP